MHIKNKILSFKKTTGKNILLTDSNQILEKRDMKNTKYKNANKLQATKL